MSSDIQLRPYHYASVSGGKDSLKMLELILANQDRYPLDAVVHFELEIDYPFVKNVTARMEEAVNKCGIAFMRIKPRASFVELYKKNGAPSRIRRWCNSAYKLDCKRQLHNWVKSMACRPIAYIGYCADETNRIKPSKSQYQIYPLVEFGIVEDDILEWAKDQPIFEDFYKYHRRQGCWVCPLQSMTDLAYLRKFYPEKFDILVNMAILAEQEHGTMFGYRTISNILKNLERSKYKL